MRLHPCFIRSFSRQIFQDQHFWILPIDCLIFTALFLCLRGTIFDIIPYIDKLHVHIRVDVRRSVLHLQGESHNWTWVEFYPRISPSNRTYTWLPMIALLRRLRLWTTIEIFPDNTLQGKVWWHSILSNAEPEIECVRSLMSPTNYNWSTDARIRPTSNQRSKVQFEGF